MNSGTVLDKCIFFEDVPSCFSKAEEPRRVLIRRIPKGCSVDIFVKEK